MTPMIQFSGVCTRLAAIGLAMSAASAPLGAQPRARAMGLAPGVFAPGPNNAITDVAGVRVGHETVTMGDSIRTGVTAIIDKFTATNYSASAATISVNLVTAAGSAGNANLITKTKTLQASEVYTFPELIGQVLGIGDFISTIAGTASAINMRVSGREVT